MRVCTSTLWGNDTTHTHGSVSTCVCMRSRPHGRLRHARPRAPLYGAIHGGHVRVMQSSRIIRQALPHCTPFSHRPGRRYNSRLQVGKLGVGHLARVTPIAGVTSMTRGRTLRRWATHPVNARRRHCQGRRTITAHRPVAARHLTNGLQCIRYPRRDRRLRRRDGYSKLL